MLKGCMARERLGSPSLVKLIFFIQRCCETVHITICSAKNLNLSPVQSFCWWACDRAKYLRKMQMVMKTNNAIVNWSNNTVFDGSQTRCFFHKTKLVRLQKANYAAVFGSVSTIRGTKLKLKLTATTFTKIASPQTNCNVKKVSLRLYEKERVV